jgi:hypothetical protein
MSTKDHRLPGEWLRRAAEAVLSQRILDGVVTPVLADLQHEAAHAESAPRWRRALVFARGYGAFWSALGLCLLTWPARSLREDWLAANAPGPRLFAGFALRGGAIGAAVTLILMLQWPTHWARQAGDPLMALATLPGVLTVAVPVALLLGLVLTLRRLDAQQDRVAARQCLGSAVGVSAVAALISFALFGWVTPEANQFVRERLYSWRSQDSVRATASGPVLFPADRRPIPRGNRELTLGELGTSIHERRLRGEPTVALEVEWHKKWSLPAMCLVFGALAVGLVGALRRWSVALPVAYAVAALVLWFLLLRLGEQAALAERVSPLVAMWSGNVTFGLYALRLLARRQLVPERVA